MADVTGPVQIWQGADDTQVPADVARGLARGRPNAFLTIVPSGHLFAVDHGAQILRAMLSATNPEQGGAGGRESTATAGGRTGRSGRPGEEGGWRANLHQR